jgi:molybdenum-dependent DNA-binding transcriptional regulator ModE
MFIEWNKTGALWGCPVAEGRSEVSGGDRISLLEQIGEQGATTKAAKAAGIS